MTLQHLNVSHQLASVSSIVPARGSQIDVRNAAGKNIAEPLLLPLRMSRSALIDLGTSETSIAQGEIIPILSCVLNRLCTSNGAKEEGKMALTPFHSLQASAISIRDYLVNLATHTMCSGECFVLLLIYIDRIVELNPGFSVNFFSIHRLVTAGLLVAAKFHDEQFFNNATFARAGGMQTTELNMLESLFLYYIRFDLALDLSNAYCVYYEELATHALCCYCSDKSHRMKQCTPFPNGFFYTLPKDDDAWLDTFGGITSRSHQLLALEHPPSPFGESNQSFVSEVFDSDMELEDDDFLFVNAPPHLYNM